jgi:hypothetical protein
MTHRQTISEPKNAQEGLANFIQMIINDIEDGKSHSALAKAVDLKDDIANEVYKITMSENDPILIDANGINKR